jgi:hypothetical protein
MWAIYFALASRQNPAQFSSYLLLPSQSLFEMSRRDDAIVAWHGVPGRTPPQKIRPVGYGMILAGVRTNQSSSSSISCARSYRTLRDGSFEDAFPGTSCQATIGVSLRDGLADGSQRHLARERASNFVIPWWRSHPMPPAPFYPKTGNDWQISATNMIQTAFSSVTSMALSIKRLRRSLAFHL